MGRKKLTGDGGVYLRGRVWWIHYVDITGKQRFESSGHSSRRAAAELLKGRLEEVQDELASPGIADTVADACDLTIAHYTRNKLRSTGHLPGKKAHVVRLIGLVPMAKVTTHLIESYVDSRQREGAKNATINRELALLRQGLRIAWKQGRMRGAPHVPMLREDNVRDGFVELPAFKRILEHLPDYLRCQFWIAYVTGWRIGEVLSRNWEHVDLSTAPGSLRVAGKQTKNNAGKEFPLVFGLRDVIDHQLAKKDEIEQRTGVPVEPLCFYYVANGTTRPGQRIVNFYDAWHTACEQAGCATLIPHDFRRTAVRNLLDAGVDETVVMRMVGLKTNAMLKRYAIVPKRTLQVAADKLDAYLQQLNNSK